MLQGFCFSQAEDCVLYCGLLNALCTAKPCNGVRSSSVCTRNSDKDAKVQLKLRQQFL